MADSKEQSFHYGGQAVIEGVMMRGPKDFAVAVRKANGEIVSSTEDIESSFVGRVKWLDKPFLRGTFALIDAMTLGMKALKYSADIAMQDAAEIEAAAKGERKAQPQEQADPKPNRVNDRTLNLVLIVGLVLGVALFVFVPIFIVKHIPLQANSFEKTALAGGIKIALFVGYVAAISMMKDVRRVFQYHGAEHKTINAYEAGVDLTVENVQQHPKAHLRCGTSFILVVLVVSIIVLMFVGWGNILRRFAYEIVLLPLIAGISYEVIRYAGKHKDSLLARLLVLPGLLMQKITTREPEPDMIEVAIQSLKNVLQKEESEAESGEPRAESGDPTAEIAGQRIESAGPAQSAPSPAAGDAAQSTSSPEGEG